MSSSLLQHLHEKQRKKAEIVHAVQRQNCFMTITAWRRHCTETFYISFKMILLMQQNH